MNGDPSKGPALDKLSILIFEELDPHLSMKFWHDFDNPLHDSLLGFLCWLLSDLLSFFGDVRLSIRFQVILGGLALVCNNLCLTW
jgi:hypothetical protein